jgi:hypothetical protein
MGDRANPPRSWAWTAVQVALHDIRSHWGTALLLVAAGTVALAAVIPIPHWPVEVLKACRLVCASLPFQVAIWGFTGPWACTRRPRPSNRP